MYSRNLVQNGLRLCRNCRVAGQLSIRRDGNSAARLQLIIVYERLDYFKSAIFIDSFANVYLALLRPANEVLGRLAVRPDNRKIIGERL
jgi:hypothetical protein